MFDPALLSDDNSDSMIPKVSESSTWGNKQTNEAEYKQTIETRLGGQKVKIETKSQDIEWIRYGIEELNRISRLQSNWDSYNADPVNQRTLEHALDVYLKLVGHRVVINAPQISAPVTGGVELLWHRGQKGLEVEIEAPLQVLSYFYDEETGEDDQQNVGIDLDTVIQRLDQVLG